MGPNADAGGAAGGMNGGGQGPGPGAPAGGAPGAKKLDPPRPLPIPVAQGFERLQLALGLGYQELTVFFVRDPSGRDRLPSLSGAVAPTVRESVPAGPATCAVRPARGGDLVLAGELLDAPLGLRVALETRRLGSKAEDVPVLALAWDALSPSSRSPAFRVPALTSSAARLALLRDEQPGPVALVLRSLSRHAQGEPELRFLQLELNRLEAEARELERRLRAMVRNTRGLRGVGFSISDGARSLDLFGSARDLSVSFPRLLRGALLEAALEGPQLHELPTGDTGPRTIREGVRASRDGHEKLLGLLREVTAPPASKPGEPLIRLAARGGKDRPGSALVRLAGDELLHGVSIAETGRGSTR